MRAEELRELMEGRSWEKYTKKLQRVPPHQLLQLAIGIMSRISIQLERLQKWGAKGGKTRAGKLSPKRRQEIARKAAAARWGKRSPAKKRGDRT